ncbi:SurA N-terminal domain-containing protein [uncultured Sphingomonas sp.]|uniref:SurA N-terminal domain-containing protein n=1 Tax=uncultured Sphingomonas sp. TaxID=158754 RepID=UPI0025DD1490|nr:SurA N-terminal domain-containing protein [uncultured Sphingomonas sp.]
MKHWSWSVVPLALLALSGCQSKPEGKGVAQVDGQAITTQVLDAELADAPPGVDRLAYRKAILPQLVDRTLLVQAAQKMGIDKTPDFAAQRERQEQKLLVEMLAQKLAATVPVPNVQAVDAYIAAHPYEFAQRQKFYVDQIRFSQPASTEALLALGQFKTLDALADALTRNATPFTRDHVLVDSAFLPAAIAAQVAKQPSGDPILLPYQGTYTANAIVQRMAAPVTGEPARALAGEILRRKAIADALGQTLKEQRKKASIAYEPGFKPDGKAADSKTVRDAADHVPAR